MDCLPSNMLNAVRAKKPLVHHITNYVTVNDCANVCICAGGAPVMTDEIDDVVDMVSIANALVINIGTLNQRTIASMLAAGKTARSKGIPVILDPVGMGATKLRTETALKIIDEVHPCVIKGNAGEMGVLSGAGGEVRGVDSAGASGDMAEIVRSIAKRYGCVAAATGPVDYVSDGEVTVKLSNGDDLMGAVSGTGCTLSSVVGSYVGANGASVESVAAAITAFNVAAEDAAKVAKGPGTFKPALLDALYALRAEELDSRVKAEKL